MAEGPEHRGSLNPTLPVGIVRYTHTCPPLTNNLQNFFVSKQITRNILTQKPGLFSILDNKDPQNNKVANILPVGLDFGHLLQIIFHREANFLYLEFK